MKNLLVSFVLLIMCFPMLFAQRSEYPELARQQEMLGIIDIYDIAKRDSIYQEIFRTCNEYKDYASLVSHMAELGKIYIGVTPDSIKAIYYINRAESLAKKNNVRKGLAKVQLYKAYYYNSRNDRLNSLDYISKTKESIAAYGLALGSMSKESLYLLVGDMFKVFNLFDSSLHNYKVAKNEAFSNMNYDYVIKSDLRIAALREESLNGDEKTVSAIYEKILSNPNHNTDSAYLSIAARKLAGILVSHGNADSAKVLLHFAYGINQRNGKSPTFILTALSRIFSAEGNADSAFHYLNIANKRVQTDIEHLQIELAFSYAYLAAGKLDSAVAYNEKAMIRSGNKPENSGVREALKQKIQIETTRKNFQQAFNSLKSLKYWEDSLMSYDNQKALLELRADFENEAAIRELEKQNEIQKLELQRSNLLIIMIIIGFIALLSIAYLIYIRQMQKRDKQTNELNQKLLRLQLNPHFIFNALSSIQSFIMTNNTREASISLAQFGELTREILDTSSETAIALAREVKMMRNYVDIQKIRFEGPIKFEVIIDPELDQESIAIPPMYIQPFIENSFEHGLLRDKGGTIRLHICKGDETLKIRIEDNGQGLNRSNGNEKYASKAISIIRERLERLRTNGRKLRELVVENIFIEGEVKGVSVKFELPLITL